MTDVKKVVPKGIHIGSIGHAGDTRIDRTNRSHCHRCCLSGWMIYLVLWIWAHRELSGCRGDTCVDCMLYFLLYIVRFFESVWSKLCMEVLFQTKHSKAGSPFVGHRLMFIWLYYKSVILMRMQLGCCQIPQVNVTDRMPCLLIMNYDGLSFRIMFLMK